LNATLADRYDYTEEEEDRGKGYLGISYLNLSVFSENLEHPLSYFDSFEGKMYGAINYILLPFYRLSPFPEHLTDAYTITGFWSFLPAPAFWFLANLLYWLFWLNLMVGLTNALPAVPLDGGHIFKDSLDSIVRRVRKSLSEKEREQVVRTISISLAFFVLFLFLWQLIGPRI
jgi:membrane-associated protease RseP (regulator of RpoE activity)